MIRQLIQIKLAFIDNFLLKNRLIYNFYCNLKYCLMSQCILYTFISQITKQLRHNINLVIILK